MSKYHVEVQKSKQELRRVCYRNDELKNQFDENRKVSLSFFEHDVQLFMRT